MKSKNLHVGGVGTQGGWLRAWWPAGLLALAQIVASSIPGTRYPQVRLPYADKLVHFGVYALLGAACARGLQRSTRRRAVALLLLAVALVAGFGVTDELHQLFVPFRSCDWHDLVADAVGACAGALAWLATVGRSRRSTDQPGA